MKWTGSFAKWYKIWSCGLARCVLLNVSRNKNLAKKPNCPSAYLPHQAAQGIGIDPGPAFEQEKYNGNQEKCLDNNNTRWDEELKIKSFYLPQ